LLARIEQGELPDVPVGEVARDEYLSEARFAAERALLARLPLVAAVDDEIAQPGACVAVDHAAAPLLLVRGADGALRGVRNACRHRATRLVDGDAPPCTKKAIVCPYHGWTYDLTGARIHVPHEDAFAGRAAERDALAPVHVASRHGIVWASLEPFDLAEFLGPIDADLAALGASGWALYRRSVRDVRGNWKLVVDAFLDAYHIRTLHRDTVYRFFLDAQAEAELAGPHIRAVTARRALLDARRGSLGERADLRELVTPSYLVFPNTILVVHPDYLSVLASFPLGVARTRFVHWMLVPERPASEADERHWAKSFTLVDEGVFLDEDLFIVEAMQRGLEAATDRTLLFGKHEHAALWFHERIAAALGTRT